MRQDTKYPINTFRKISIFTLVVMGLFTALFLFYSTKQIIKFHKFEQSFEQFPMLIALQKELFQERGVSALYLAKGGKIDSEILSKERERTDLAMAKAVDYYAPNSAQYKKFLGSLRGIIDIRRQIDMLKMSYEDIFSKYFVDTSDLIIKKVESIRNNCISNRICPLISTLILNLNGAQNISQKRDYPILAISQHRNFTSDEAKTWINILNKSDEYATIIPNSQIQGELNATIANIIDETKISNQAYILPNSLDVSIPSWNIIFRMKFEAIYAQSYILLDEIEKIKRQVGFFYNLSFISSIITTILYLIVLLYGLDKMRYLRRNTGDIAQMLDEITELAYDEDLKLMGESDKNLRLRILDTIRLQSNNMLNKQKDVFLSNISHKLKDPLGNIIGFTDLLRENNLDKKCMSFVTNIKDSSEKLLKTINNVIEISRIESKNITYTPESITPIVRFSNLLYLGTQKIKDLAIDVRILGYVEPSITQGILADLPKVRMICDTMIDNSLDAMNKPKGTIVIKIERLRSLEENKILVRFSVEDNGRGMSRTTMDKLFEDFSGIDNTIANKIYNGKGLGLGIAAKYVQMMGSKIDVQSKLGVGSRFSVDLYFETENINRFNYKNKFQDLEIEILEPNSDEIEFIKKGKKDFEPNIQIGEIDYDSLYYEFLCDYLDYMGVSYEFVKVPSGDKIVYTRDLSQINDKIRAIYASSDDFDDKTPNIATIKEPFDIIRLANCIEKSREKVARKVTLSKLDINILSCGDDDLFKALSEICLNVFTLQNVPDISKIDFAFIDLKVLPEFTLEINNDKCALIEVVDSGVPLSKGYRWTDFVQKPLNKDKIIDVISHARHSAMLTNQNLRDILLFKRSIAANNIYASSLKTLCPKIDSVLDMDGLKKALAQNPYRLVLIDYDVPNFQTNVILEWLTMAKNLFKIDTKIGVFISSNMGVGADIEGKFDAIIESALNNQQLEQVIERMI